MDPKPYLSQIADDEGLTSGIADAEAYVLLDWLREKVEAAARAADSKKKADTDCDALRGRARKISKLVAAWCIDDEEDRARELWAELGCEGSIEELPRSAATAAMTRMLAAEDARHA